MAGQQSLDNWLTQVNRVCGKFRARTLGDRFQGAIDEFHANAMKLSTVTVSQACLYRTSKEIAQSDDAWFYTVFQLDGEAFMEQDGRQARLQAGDITLIDASRPSTFSWRQESRQISLLLPRRQLEQSMQFAPIPCATALPATLPMVKLSHNLLRESMGEGPMSAQESEAAMAAIGALLRPLLQGGEPAVSKRDRQFDAVLAFIDEQIQSSELRPEWIAGQNNLSVRSLYRMFAARGLVVAQYIKNRRLDLCAEALRSPANQEKLAGIGLNWGFADHSHFSTAFKQRFGVSPSAWRKRYL